MKTLHNRPNRPTTYSRSSILLEHTLRYSDDQNNRDNYMKALRLKTNVKQNRYHKQVEYDRPGERRY